MAPTNITVGELFAKLKAPDEIASARVYNIKASALDRSLDITLFMDEIIPYEIIEDFKERAMEVNNLHGLIIRVKYNGLSLARINLEKILT